MARFAVTAVLIWLGLNAAFFCVRLWVTRPRPRTDEATPDPKSSDQVVRLKPRLDSYKSDAA